MIGMNRLRHAYLELAPELEPYFVTGHHDDEASIMQSYSHNFPPGLTRIIAGTPTLVNAINVVVVGVFAAFIAGALGAAEAVSVVVGIVAALAAVVGLYRYLSENYRAASAVASA